ncbi:uncharacterized protein LOC133926360 isoform X3 [Phragmites australis]|uniref:uncharacterized protein LOC133926360 isoform X3 n=1 Tax=Phragmites australis TaxID=29695 RepID=UPI002D7733D5|nr:uncharacterized protein LOC133926360 isoform X3 [Phragmites australis]XP_062228253.1 uncharacterized protein LOC133926360 isoform X3 [Phragmites australis]XP_062228254.1 uncharacterized protein LOC133926360 isoform X3 [Phragmites australis]
MQPDLILFTGDYGNENVQLVKSISDLQLPKAAIFGNHDCWHTHQFSEKKAARVRLQLDSLGEQHVGYRCLALPTIKLSVVGGRPFSCGGDRLFRPKLLSKWLVRNILTDRYICFVTSLFGTLVFLCHFLGFDLRDSLILEGMNYWNYFSPIACCACSYSHLHVRTSRLHDPYICRSLAYTR